MAGSFNLSAWALQNRALVLYAMIVLGIVGVFSYQRLGQSEDPPFSFKLMVVQTLWPGATAQEVAEQVTDRIEKELMETGQYEFIRSYSRAGESMVMFMAKDSMVSAELPPLWYAARKKIGDIRHTLPAGIVGPFFNDEFGDTFGTIYALQAKGLDYATLEDYAERIELALHRVPDVAKVELIGLQQETIWIELSNTKLAALGVPLEAVQRAIDAQNAVVGASFFETPTHRVKLRVSGAFDSVESIRQFPIRVGEHSFRLGDVAEVHRGFVDPAAPRMRFMGEDAIGIGISMRKGGDILELGERLQAEFAQIQQTLPAGMSLTQVADQPAAVRDSVGEFVRVLAEAVLIVLLVCFLSLGWRSGLVVALSIPLVLAMTFASMYFFDIGLHKVSLGALILALGLLVDDAIIAIEMMQVKMEEGLDRLAAAAYTYQHMAFPMLTGTLITAAGFLPIATAASSTGEYTRSIFQVVVLALVLSWVAAVIFIPYLGDKLLPDRETLRAGHGNGFAAAVRRELARRLPPRLAPLVAPTGTPQDDPYATPFYRSFRETVAWSVRHRKTVIALTVVLFLLSVAMFRFVPQQFFPSSTRLELMVDIELAEGSSMRATEAAVQRFEEHLQGHEGIESFVAYVGSGSPRFYLPLDQKLPQANFAQFVLRTPDIETREEVKAWLQGVIDTEFGDLQGRVTRLENGPPVGFPVQFRVSGEHADEVLRIARELKAEVRTNPHVRNVNLDWDEPSKVVRLRIDQDRARALGVSSAEVATFLRGSLSGTPVSTFREGNELIEILLRGPEQERTRLDMLGSLAVPTAGGRSVPLAQVADIEYGFEHGILWHRNRLPTVTVRADVETGITPPTVTQEILPRLDDLRAALPPGFLLETGGTVEDAARGSKSVVAGIPLLLFAVITLLMLQLRSFSRTAMVLLTAPLGLIGVTWFLLIPQVPFGFVAMLGTIALSGMIMRNAVILIDQIERHIAEGMAPFVAVVEAAVRRFRPIVLTALTAVLAMIPLSRSVFFGPMAVAIMGGLIVATALTLLFLPALYAAWFRIKAPPPAPRY